MITKIISGGQTGVDQSALRAAIGVSPPFQTGGWMPKGFLTELGSNPGLAKKFNLIETESSDYPTRTEKNILYSDLTLWIKIQNKNDSRGYNCTLKAAQKYKKDFLVSIIKQDNPESIANIIFKLTNKNKQEILNIAGSRESLFPGIGKIAELWLIEMLQELTKLNKLLQFKDDQI